MKKNLPTLTINGKEQELIELEIHLLLAGYKSDESWNNTMMQSKRGVSKIRCYGSILGAKNTYAYFSNLGLSSMQDASFNATQIDEILLFIKNFNSNGK